MDTLYKIIELSTQSWQDCIRVNITVFVICFFGAYLLDEVIESLIKIFKKDKV